MTSGTGVACRWRIVPKQQGTDNCDEVIWFTLWSPFLITEDEIRWWRMYGQQVTSIPWCTSEKWQKCNIWFAPYGLFWLIAAVSLQASHSARAECDSLVAFMYCSLNAMTVAYFMSACLIHFVTDKKIAFWWFKLNCHTDVACSSEKTTFSGPWLERLCALLFFVFGLLCKIFNCSNCTACEGKLKTNLNLYFVTF